MWISNLAHTIVKRKKPIDELERIGQAVVHNWIRKNLENGTYKSRPTKIEGKYGAKLLTDRSNEQMIIYWNPDKDTIERRFL